MLYFTYKVGECDMKKFIKNNILGFIIGAIIFGTVGVVATNYAANQIAYNKNGKATVADALDGLYDRVPNAETIDRYFCVHSSSNLSKSNSYTATKKGKIIIFIGLHSGVDGVDNGSSYSVTKNGTTVTPTYQNTGLDSWNRTLYYIFDVNKDDVISYSMSVTKAGSVDALSFYAAFVSN